MRTFDVAVLGATGFTGKLACEYLSTAYGSSGGKVSYVAAGRSQDKLAALRNDLPELNIHLCDCTEYARVFRTFFSPARTPCASPAVG